MIRQELEYMYGLQRFGVKPGLDAMERLMKALGYPERKFRSVHIAGTNGKGSTAAFLSSVLDVAGYTVGLYTSPHLVKFNERIRLNGVDISDEELAGLVALVRKATEAADIQATFFEFTTALAFVYFAQQHVDMAVIEVGMGGRLDATNVMTPLVSVITTIGLDHTEVLGDTLEKIAAEKAGIIKPGVPVVIGEKKPDVVAYLQQAAQAKGSPAVIVAEEMQVKDIDASLFRQKFAVEGSIQGQFEIHLLGRHQIDNALTALSTIAQLRGQRMDIPQAVIQKGMAAARWDGRMQVVSHQPLVIVDGAHNEDGMEALYEFIKDFSKHSVLVVAQKRDKQLSLLHDKIVPLFNHVIATEGTYQPMKAETLAKELSRIHQHVGAIPDVAGAIDRARALLPADGFLLVSGSLYMVGGALEHLKRKFP